MNGHTLQDLQMLVFRDNRHSRPPNPEVPMRLLEAIGKSMD